MKILNRLCAAASLGLVACGSVSVSDFADQKPVLDLQTYFNGRVDAWGMFQKRSGQVAQRFQVRIDGSWQGDVGTLDEQFSYSDGSTSRRVWTIRKTATGQYIGTADDVVGEAKGEAAGNALNWRYTLALPVDGKIYNVQFDDWMFLQDGDVMINRAHMSKWGYTLGEVTLFFKKTTP